MTSIHDATRRRLDAELAAQQDARYDLTLFVNGASDLASRAIANARTLCDTHLRGRADLTVVDIHADVDVMIACGVVATPTLMKNWPLPIRRILGDLSQIERVLTALDLPIGGPVGPDIAGAS